MSIRLEIEGRGTVEIAEESIVLGTDPTCAVEIPTGAGVAPKHAVIRKIAGRWIIEVRAGDSIQVGDADPARMYWLNPGDIIRLTDSSPSIVFEPQQSARKDVKPAARTKADAVDSFQLSKPKTIGLASIDAENTSSKQAPPKSKPAAPPKSDEFAEAPAPALPSLSTPIRSDSWLNDSAASAANARRNRSRRRFWMQAGGSSLLTVIAILVWISFGRRTTPQIDPAPPVGTTSIASATTSGSDKPLVLQTPTTVPAGPSPKAEQPPEQQATPVASKPVEPRPAVVSGSPVPLQKSSTKGPSATLVAVRDGVYAVLAKRPDDDIFYRLGTAWAASRRQLVTSGAVALAAEALKAEGAVIVVAQPFQERQVTIKSSRAHPAYTLAVERATSARARMTDESKAPAKDADEQAESPATELAKALSNQARFDLGVLDIEPGQRLETFLRMQTDDLGEVASEYLLVGFPFTEKQYQISAVRLAGDAREQVSVRNSALKSDSDLTLTMKFAADMADEVWSGSPVIDGSQRVIAVYSRIAAPAQPNESPQKRRHAVIWLGRLREFASELE